MSDSPLDALEKALTIREEEARRELPPPTAPMEVARILVDGLHRSRDADAAALARRLVGVEDLRVGRDRAGRDGDGRLPEPVEALPDSAEVSADHLWATVCADGHPVAFYVRASASSEEASL